MTLPFTPFTRHETSDFLIAGPDHSLAVAGQKRLLPQGSLDSLADRADGFFKAGHDGLQRLVGAVPYDRHAMDYLFQPVRILTDETGIASPVLVAPSLANMTPEPSVRQYRASVSEALHRIAGGEFEKIVLSRSLSLSAQTPFDEGGLLVRMRQDRQATTFSTPLPADEFGRARRLIGATPELLVERRGRMVASHPLAGSARRSDDPVADRAIGQALLKSDKDRREHEMVSQMVLDTLAPYCEQLSAPEGMALTTTARMWHLGTRITGRLRDPATPCAQLLAALHPTPAICGQPRDAADAALPQLEGRDRGFYAGAVGWLDDSGDGCWYLALRCAEISGTRARLYAGAGIVAGSDPHAEEAETSAKFLAMLTAFGLDEEGAPLKDTAPAHD